MIDPYFTRPEVSNSDLTELKKYWMPEEMRFDVEQAFKFGTLIDAMITEPHRLNYFNYTVDQEQYTAEDFYKAEQMKKSFYKDQFCLQMVKHCVFQKVSVKHDFEIEYDGLKFTLPARCKWDLFSPHFDMSGDIKSTTATTQKQCEEAVRYFDYERSRAWYMDIENRTNDIIIFISKVNFKVFKVPVKRGSELYKEGKAKYQDLAFKYWYLFGDITNENRIATAEDLLQVG
jgi:hypothetical protein